MIGRTKELEELNTLFNKKTSSLVVVKGRRRIGKSTLIQFFGKNQSDVFVEFSGLAPVKGQTNQDQINHFCNQYKLKAENVLDWDQAFEKFADKILKNRNKKIVVLFDEISWMGRLDINFPGKLKNIWDIRLKHQPQFILVLCGSVSAWIQENILNSTAFVGRVSLTQNIDELPLKVVSQFWGKWQKKVSVEEKIRYLCVTGCIPKYLEELDPSQSTEENVLKLCFNPSGFLYDEFNKIFADIFGGKVQTYKRIINTLIDKNLSAQEIADKIGIVLSTDLLNYLKDLEVSGFIRKDSYYGIGMSTTKSHYYRLRDNYLRFALKYISQVKARVGQLNSQYKSLDLLPNWKSIVGLQFENVILNHLPEVLNGLNIPIEQIVLATPFYQKKTTRNKAACQIDLLVQTKDNTAYICEFKFKKEIDESIIKEVDTKIKKLTKKKGWSYRPVLIYEGEIHKNQASEIKSYFSKILKIGDLL